MTRAEVLGVAQAVCEEVAFNGSCDDPAKDLLEVSAAIALIASALRDRPPVEQRALLLGVSMLSARS